MIKRAKERGFTVTLLFFWLRSIELAKVRVATRVLEGGLNIPSDVIERRYKSGITNLFRIYLPLVDEWFVYDSSEPVIELIAENNKASFIRIKKSEKMATAKPTQLKKNRTTSEKLEEGMKLVKADLMAYKKAKNSKLVVLKDDKIVFLNPE